MDHKSGLMYSFAAIAAVTVLAQADDVAAASTHTVRAGDTLWSISQQHNIPLATLKSVNNLTSDRIAIGQTLRLSGAVALAPANNSATKTRTTTANLNLRSGAGTTHSVLLTIPRGQTLTPLKTSGVWTQVTYSGRTGWVHSDFLSATPAPATPTPAPTAPVVTPNATTTSKTTANLNLRASKSTSARILTTIPSGKSVTVLKVEGTWSHVKYGTHTGFVANTYLTKAASTPAPTQPATPAPSQPTQIKEENINTSYVTTANLNVRQGAGTGFALVTTIPNGTTVTATKQSGSWVYVTYNGKAGYVSTGFLKQMTTAPSAPVAPNLGDAGAGNTNVDYVVNTPSLNVRASATTSSAIIGSVTAGQTLRVVQTSNGWHQIYIGNTTGFVSASFVKQVPKGTATNPTWVSGSYDAHTFFTASPVAIRAQASDTSAIVGSTLRGGLLNITGETATHYRVAEGFIAKAHVTQVSGQSAQATRLATIAVAQRFVGTPYVWASSSPVNGGFDCSGLIFYAFNQAGVNIPRTNVANYWGAAYFGPQLPKSFTPQAGDLVFFENTYTAGPSHMGIMINADTFIHAGTSGLGYNQISKEPYWQSRLLGYKRP
ncbi:MULTISPECIES: C40 family peptidase [Exiguobacterium]|uniref:C40 family peptidase n=1 Tax=Exiguobacterium TaxID=33986 RepID=UPI002036933E|nr:MULTISPECIES: C40 family peptidase [Exiguobacterium]MCT4781679.1 SH3 domain-containing protein [Exiguobacterium himgiriensis]